MELEFSTDLDAKGLDFGESFAMSTGDLPSVIAGENRYERNTESFFQAIIFMVQMWGNVGIVLISLFLTEFCIHYKLEIFVKKYMATDM